MTERLSLPDVHALARDCLTRAGAPIGVAQAVAAEIAAAEGAGERRHGMEALLRDIRLMRYGRLRAAAPASDRRPRPGLMLCDAGHGFAAAALAGAVGAFADIVRSQGIAVLRLDRASDPGAMIHTVARLAEKGLAVLAMGATGPGRVAHPGIAAPTALTHPPREALALLLSPQGGAQPADSPIGDLVAHRAWIVALDADLAGEAPLPRGIWPATPAATPPPAAEIVFSAELLEQIVTA